ncbi:MAG: YfhO family protein [Bifidobacterium psychraerophilum]|uniref:YfhO family protein n=1 Tax=Bifidobacterium psychraerophilum TaxID=218140 RepID=UPI0039EAD04C
MRTTISDGPNSEESLVDGRPSAASRGFAFTAVGIGIVTLLLVTYSAVIFGGWKISFTNMTYSVVPFNSSGVATRGPVLSDIADNVLPIAFASFHPFNFTAWLAGFGIGTTPSSNIYMSPLNYLYLLPLDVAQTAIMVVKLIVAFGSMFFLMKQLGYTWRGSFISGASFALCSVMVMWNGWPHSEVTMYAPLLFLLLDKLLKRLSVKYVVGIALVVYLMLIAGMPTYAAYFLYLGGAYVLFYGLKTYHAEPKRLLAYFVWFAFGVALGALLSLPYSAELLNTVGSNGYSDSRKDFASKVLDFAQFKTLFFPYAPTSSPIHANEGTLYTGILAAITVPFSLLHFKKKQRIGFFLVAAVIMVLLIFTGLLDPVYVHLPMISTSLKFRVIVLLNFCLAVVVGMNMDDLLTTKVESLRARVQIWSAGFISCLIFALMLWRIYPQIDDNDASLHHSYIIYGVVGAFVLVIIIKTVSLNRMLNNACVLLMICGVAVDMGFFASQYQPLIANDAPAIPKATDSISYIQQNTKEEQKIATIGTWEFFPSTNMFYGIRNVTGHGFFYTQPDVIDYFDAIDSNVFSSSPTRPAFTSIHNENLLKYMGVKYLAGSADSMGDRKVDQSAMTAVGPVSDSSVISQEFTAAKDGLDHVRVLLGTGGAGNAGTAVLRVQDPKSGKVVATSTLAIGELQDNNWATFSFDPIAGSAGQTYTMTLSTSGASGTGLAVYTSGTDSYPGTATFGETDATVGDVVMSCFYEDDRMGSDGMVIRELDEYSPQVELTDSVSVVNNEDDVLKQMEQSYSSSTVFFSKSVKPKAAVSEKQTPLSSDETISGVENNSNGSISFDVHTNEKRYVLINEYNDGNWIASVDGKTSTVYKGNYLFRAVEVPAGEHHVVLRYESSGLKSLLAVSTVSLLLVGTLFVLRNRLDRAMFSRLNSNESEESGLLPEKE